MKYRTFTKVYLSRALIISTFLIACSGGARSNISASLVGRYIEYGPAYGLNRELLPHLNPGNARELPQAKVQSDQRLVIYSPENACLPGGVTLDTKFTGNQMTLTILEDPDSLEEIGCDAISEKWLVLVEVLGDDDYELELVVKAMQVDPSE